jgi:hypothetical protein
MGELETATSTARGFGTKATVGGQDQSPFGGTIGTTAWSPILANRGRRPPPPGKPGAAPAPPDFVVPAPGQIRVRGLGPRGRGSGVPLGPGALCLLVEAGEEPRGVRWLVHLRR